MRGVLHVNKPSGMTSYDVIRRIKRECLKHQAEIPMPRSAVPDPQSAICNTPRAATEIASAGPRNDRRRGGPQSAVPRIGHAGTLDRMAQGVLLVLLGEATKIADFLLSLEKEYVALVRLGIRTDTDDITGQVLEERPTTDVSLTQIQARLPEFTGELEQMPPVYSALKLSGIRASDRARRGEMVTPEPRRITVREIEASDFALPLFRMRVVVSRGTYVRSLARDLGEKLGCGATLEALTRTRIGGFRIQDAVELDALDANRVLQKTVTIREAVSFLPSATVRPAAAAKLRDGRPIRPDEIQTWQPAVGESGPSPESPSSSYESGPGPVCLSDEAGSMLVVARFIDGMWRSVRGIYADR